MSNIVQGPFQATWHRVIGVAVCRLGACVVVFSFS